jgi:hypothetical protein
MKWLLIDTVPDDQAYSGVIVAEGNAVGEARHFGEKEGWYWAGNDPTDSWGGRIYPTHWMPLPSPPKTTV